MLTSRLHYTRYNDGNGQRGGATVKRFYLLGYLVAWRTVDTWFRLKDWPRTAPEVWRPLQTAASEGGPGYAPPDEVYPNADGSERTVKTRPSGIDEMLENIDLRTVPPERGERE